MHLYIYEICRNKSYEKCARLDTENYKTWLRETKKT